MDHSLFFIFKDFFEFVTILLLFYVWDFWLQGMWNLSSLTGDRIHISCIGRQSLNHWITRDLPKCYLKLVLSIEKGEDGSHAPSGEWGQCSASLPLQWCGRHVVGVLKAQTNNQSNIYISITLHLYLWYTVVHSCFADIVEITNHVHPWVSIIWVGNETEQYPMVLLPMYSTCLLSVKQL